MDLLISLLAFLIWCLIAIIGGKVSYDRRLRKEK